MQNIDVILAGCHENRAVTYRCYMLLFVKCIEVVCMHRPCHGKISQNEAIFLRNFLLLFLPVEKERNKVAACL